LDQSYKADFVCFEKIIVEPKAVKELTPEHEAELLNDLKATGLKLGLLVNFGSYPNAQVERRILSNSSRFFPRPSACSVVNQVA
jgi:GxxExxY protein